VEKRLSLISKVRKLEESALDDLATVVSVEDFFDSNTDEGSIVCNLIPHPGIDFFFKHLLEIRNHTEVQALLVQIYEVDEKMGTWPFSERIFVYTSLPKDEISRMMKSLKYDEIEAGFIWGRPLSSEIPQPGMKGYGFWWD
jgi:hypothetical protein